MSNQQQKDKMDKTATYSAAFKNNSRSYDINNMYIDKKVNAMSVTGYSKYFSIYLPDETLDSQQLLMTHRISFHLHSPPRQNHSVTEKGK